MPVVQAAHAVHAAQRGGHLAGHDQLVVLFVPGRRLLLVVVVEHEGDGGLGDAGLALLVHELLQVARADLAQVAAGGSGRQPALVTPRPHGPAAPRAPLAPLVHPAHLMPSTKQMASRMLLLPLPFRPVMALNAGSNPEMTVFVA